MSFIDIIYLRGHHLIQIYSYLQQLYMSSHTLHLCDFLYLQTVVMDIYWFLILSLVRRSQT